MNTISQSIVHKDPDTLEKTEISPSVLLYDIC